MEKIILAALIISISFGCDVSVDDSETDIAFEVNDFEAIVNERPEEGFLLGAIDAFSSAGELTYQLVAEDPKGAMSVDQLTGEIVVLDPNLFVFEDNVEIRALVEVNNESEVKTSNILIEIRENATEFEVNDFTTAVDERPDEGVVLGTLDASSSNGELTFRLMAEEPQGAISVDRSTGEIAVLNADLFVFEDHPEIRATVRVDNGEEQKNLEVLIKINEGTSALEVNDFVIDIDERPEQGSRLGTIDVSSSGGTLTFRLFDEDPDGAIAVNESNGRVIVANSDLFVYADHTSIRGSVEVSNGSQTKTLNIIITINEPQQKSPTIWTGEKMTFTKGDGTDETLAENQDRITDNVWITRSGNEGGPIFNIRQESFNNNGPSGTEWAEGTTNDIESLTFNDLRTTLGGGRGAFREFFGKTFVMHLIEEDIYLEVTFISWSRNNNGGFSYERTTE